jgi:hypothetical protein
MDSKSILSEIIAPAEGEAQRRRTIKTYASALGIGVMPCAPELSRGFALRHSLQYPDH